MSYFSPRACGDKAEASAMTVALTSMMGDADLSDIDLLWIHSSFLLTGESCCEYVVGIINVVSML